MAIKVLSWNIFRFADSLVSATDRINRVLDLVHPIVGGVGAPAFQVFVIIEPQNVSFLAPGEIAQGAGTLGIHQLLGKLQNRNGGVVWRVAPPLSLAQGGKEAETMAVFYDSTVLRLTGPKQSANVGPPWNTLPGDPGKLFWTDRTRQVVRRAELDGSGRADVATNVVAESLRFDLRHKHVCWVDTTNNKISAAPIAGGGPTDLVSGVGTPRHLAVDSYRGTLYWIDTANMNAVMRAHLDGTNPKEVKTHKNKNSVTSSGLRAFEQNPRKEQVEAYWLDQGTVSYLHGKMSDLRRTDYGASKSIDARSLAIDFANERLYWIDDTSHEIRRGKLNGAGAVLLVTTGVSQDLRLEPAGGHLFWRDEATRSLRRFGIHATPVVPQDVVRPDQPDLFAIDTANSKIYWLYRNNNRTPNRIRSTNMDCTGGRDVVATGQPTHLSVAGRLYWTDGATHQILCSGLDGNNQGTLTGPVNAGSFAVDETNHRIYWVDEAAKRIKATDLNAPYDTEDISNPGDPDHVALDPANKKVYWIERQGMLNKLMQADLDGQNSAEVASAATIAGFALDPARNKLYWVERGPNRILEDGLNGGSATPMVTAGDPDRVVLDAANTALCWFDATDNKWKQHDLNTHVDEDMRTPGEPGTYAVDQPTKKIYWVDKCTRFIRRANLDGSGEEDVVKNEEPDEIAIYSGAILTGQCVFKDAGLGDIYFDSCGERRPYLVAFETGNPPNNHTLYVVGVHSPSPDKKGNYRAQNGTKNLAQILEITTNRGGAGVVIVGDFNCCTMGAANPACTGYMNHDTDVNAFDDLKTAGYGLHVTDERTSLKGGSGEYKKKTVGTNPDVVDPNGYTEHAYDHALTTGFATVQNAKCVDLVAKNVEDWRTSSAQKDPPKKTFDRLLGEIFKGKGVSDHLPIEIEIDF